MEQKGPLKVPVRGCSTLSDVSSDKCYNFDWFRLLSHDQRQLMLKTFDFKRLKRVPWFLFQGIVLGSSYGRKDV